jgi:hypothetical protein
VNLERSVSATIFSLNRLITQWVPDDTLRQRIELADPADLSFYDQYEKLYEEVLGKVPELRGDTAPEPREELEDVRNEGLLKVVLDERQWAG